MSVIIVAKVTCLVKGRSLRGTLAERLIDFYLDLQFPYELPPGFRVMNPFREPRVQTTIQKFYLRFLDDDRPRRVLMGINPGRHGGGVTGIPFTDTKRLVGVCGLEWDGPSSHEPSSEFFYAMACYRGDVSSFYGKFFSFPVSPLGFLQEKEKGKWLNANYYDSPQLLETVRPFIVASLDRLASWNIDRTVGFCLGQGPNLRVLEELNHRYRWFARIVALPHPRFIIQYKRREMTSYLELYWRELLA